MDGAARHRDRPAGRASADADGGAAREADAQDGVDVAIVGYGPVGATLAGLLGRSGLRVAVYDKALEVFPQPRAVGFDHDAMRLFQRIGIAAELAPHIEHFRDSRYLGVDGQVIQNVRRMSPPHPYGWAPNFTCDQPGLEAVLRGAVARMPGVRVCLGHEVVGAHDEGDGARLEVRGPDGAHRTLRAAWLVGCDGASSLVRKGMGIALESLDYDRSWVVVDLKVHDAFLRTLPDTNVQYCEPRRPSTYIVCPGNHRRWEFMLLDGEDAREMVAPERLWRLLARWIVPGRADLWRAAAYRFHALIARDFRQGRLLLAGDSAHQTPPFLGQGMCQGLRDAGNLAWKLEAVLRGRAGESLLDSYARERRPHVAATTRMAKQLGLMLSECDEPRARERDAQLLASGGGRAPTLIRQDMIPGLEAGVIDPAGSPRSGRGFPQPRVARLDGAQPAAEQLLDDVVGPCFRLVAMAPAEAGDDALAGLARLARERGLPLLLLARTAGQAPALADEPGVVTVTESDGLLAGWLRTAGMTGALVRPDHYVYGTFRDVPGATALLDALATQLAAPLAAQVAAQVAAEPSIPTKETTMQTTRRRLLGAAAALPAVLPSVLAGAGGALLAPRGANAQDWPVKPVRLVVPTPPGSGPDSDMRQMSVHLSALLGQPVIVDNRPGAATRIAAEAVARAAPDGYTFLVATPSIATMSSLYPKLAFDPRRDLVPVCLASVTNYTLAVNAAVPAHTLAEYVKLAKAEPRYADFGTLGAGAINHLTGAWFGALAGVDVKFIHYNTTGPFTDLVSGQIPALFDAMLPLMGHVKSGKVRFLGISGKSRNPLIPDVPTFAEAGMPALDPLVWIGLLAPAGTPQPVVARMSAALTQVARMPEIVAARRAVGSESTGGTPEEFGAFLDAERAKWGAVIRRIGLTLE